MSQNIRSPVISILVGYLVESFVNGLIDGPLGEGGRKNAYIGWLWVINKLDIVNIV